MGEYDFYINLAWRFGWTPEQIDRMDPDYIDELTARIEAQAAHDNKPRPKK